jgi:hypothetical protein
LAELCKPNWLQLPENNFISIRDGYFCGQNMEFVI